ncbi:hypothetical protein H4582DRAFT_2044443 [Lactarius indigo]|nr:hypothetical protein H4582DRAFT_2044443 [Lactarius indigo]
MFNNLPGPSIIADTLASGAKAISGEYHTLFPAYHTLQKCSETLQDIRALLDGISQHRRRKIQNASERGFCLSLESLELELDRCIRSNRSIAIFGLESEMFSGLSVTIALYADSMNNRRCFGVISQASYFNLTSSCWRTASGNFTTMHGKRPCPGPGRLTGGQCAKRARHEHQIGAATHSVIVSPGHQHTFRPPSLLPYMQPGHSAVYHTEQ